MTDFREHERKTLSALKRLGGKASAEQLAKEARLPGAAVMRAVLTLQERNMIRTDGKKQRLADFTEEGKAYAESGLPERRLMVALENLGRKAHLEEVVAKAGLDKRFVPITLGWVQRKRWAAFDPKTGTLQMLGEPAEGSDEKLLKLLAKAGQAMTVEDLEAELQEAAHVLKGRKLLKVEEKTMKIIELTDAGRAAVRKGLVPKTEVTQLTPELITSGRWRKTKLQEYNIEAPVAKTWPGKKHPYLAFLDEVREKLVALGFKEMTGTAVESALFNFDALYTPQGHLAREPSSVYYTKSPKYGITDAYKRVLANVKETHENGWKTGSSGWRYRYSVKEAARLILRPHTTCLSARTLVSRDLEVPGMYFSLGRCYRPEALDRMHLTEFNQVEGIVVDRDLTLRNLLGVLEKFAIDIAGADRAKFVPDYFPFTEPSVELRAYKKGYGWIEFGGSGVFRPEVTSPLGIDVPVLAWGLGIDRLFMLKARIDDIRQVFSTDLGWLRKQEVA